MQRLNMAFATFIIAVFAAPDYGHAGLIIEAPSIATMPGTSGSFDVTIHNDNAMGGASYNIGGFGLILSLSGSPGVHFTAVDILTSIDYVFLIPFSENGGAPFATGFSGTSFNVSDSEIGSPFYRSINPGDSFGLARVSYNVDANAANGSRPLILDPVGTSLSDDFADAVDFMSIDGDISVHGDLSVVPEPSSGVLLSMGLICAMFASYQRARRTSAQYPGC